MAGPLARRRPPSHHQRSDASQVLRARHVPVPSGAGLHVGHCEGYTATDVITRWKRMSGFNVLHPMGWDAFGLPAENYAIKHGVHPRVTTEAAIANFRRQIDSVGFAYDWDARDQHHRSGVHEVDAVDLPAAVEARPRLRGRRPHQLVPRRQDRPGQRGGEPGALRALRHAGRAQGHAAVAAAHHPLRRSPARGSGRAGLARVDAWRCSATGSAAAKGPRCCSRAPRRCQGGRSACSRRGPTPCYGATYMVLAPEHPLVGGADDARAAQRGRGLPAAGPLQERPRAHRSGQGQDRRGDRRDARSTP